MKIRNPLLVIVLGVCLIPYLGMATNTQPTNSSADNRPNAEISVVSKDDLNAQKELFQFQLDAKKELLQKDIEAQSKRIDAFEKRIEDQTNRISDISASVDRFGILITLLFFVAGLLGYRAAKNDAREAAKEAAEQSAAKWFEDNHKNLLSRMEELEARAIKASQTIDTHEAQVVEISNAAHAEIEASKEKIKADEKKVNEQMEIFQRQLSQYAIIGTSENQSSKDNSAIEQKAEQLKQKPENEYTFIDWNTRAFAAYSEGKFEDAIFYWDKAIVSADIKSKYKAQAMFNKGATLSRLNRDEDALAVYDAIIAQFDMAEKLNLRGPVARAMLHKGIALGRLKRNEEAIAVYDAVIIQLGAAEELNLRELVVNAMVNKHIRLNQLNRSEEAIAVCDAIITQFGATEEMSFREQVSIAWNGKGFNLLCKAKANWENVDLATEQLVNASIACTSAISKNSDNGLAHGNLAYISWLQGDAVAAEQHFRTGLSSAKEGGEILYKGTLTDFDIHPIEPDQGFRELVEKLWAEYKQSQ